MVPNAWFPGAPFEYQPGSGFHVESHSSHGLRRVHSGPLRGLLGRQEPREGNLTEKSIEANLSWNGRRSFFAFATRDSLSATKCLWRFLVGSPAPKAAAAFVCLDTARHCRKGVWWGQAPSQGISHLSRWPLATHAPLDFFQGTPLTQSKARGHSWGKSVLCSQAAQLAWAKKLVQERFLQPDPSRGAWIWVWLKIKQEGTAGSDPCFHLPGQPILEFRSFGPQPFEWKTHRLCSFLAISLRK